MRRGRGTLAVALALAVGLGAACGSKSSEPGPPEGYVAIPPRAPMTPAERVAAIGKIEEALNEALPDASVPWDERDLAAEVLAAGARLEALPEVVAVLVVPELASATIVLADGFTIDLINNRPPRPESTARVVADAPRRTPHTGAPTPATLPASLRAVTASYDGGGAVAVELGDRLGVAGFDVLPLGPSLASMSAYQDLGFLYLDTHSSNFIRIQVSLNGFGEVNGFAPQLDAEGQSIATYTIQSSTRVDAEVLAAIESELAGGGVVVALSQGFLGGWQAHLGINEQYIADHWTFDDAIVILHTCFSGAPPFSPDQSCIGTCPDTVATLDARPLREAILAAGANAVMSFDKGTFPIEASPSLYYFVDRLTGANVESPSTPAHRPFDWRAVYAAMEQNGLSSFVLGTKTVNILMEGAEEAVALAPSIRALDVVDDVGDPFGLMTIHGQFGDAAGTVTIAGADLTLASWADDKIVTQLPFDRTGDVVVTDADGRASNAVPVTQWSGTLTYNAVQDLSLFKSMTATVRFRGDMHLVREAVDAEPQGRVADAYVSSPAVTGECSGLGSYNNGIGVETFYDGGEPLLVYGPAVIDALASGTRPTPAYSGTSEFAALAHIDPARSRVRLCLWMTGYHDVYKNGELEPEEYSYFALEHVGFFTDASEGLLDCVDMTMSPGGAITGGKKTYSIEGSFVELEWKDFSVIAPPPDTTPG